MKDFYGLVVPLHWFRRRPPKIKNRRYGSFKVFIELAKLKGSTCWSVYIQRVRSWPLFFKGS